MVMCVIAKERWLYIVKRKNVKITCFTIHQQVLGKNWRFQLIYFHVNLMQMLNT